MKPFHTPEIADFAWVQPFLNEDVHPGADYTFHNMLFWKNYYGKLGVVDGKLTQVNAFNGRLLCLYPAGKGDKTGAVRALKDLAASRGLRLALRGLTDETLPEFTEVFGEEVAVTPFYDAFDYIYAIEDLCNLPGKHLQSKRNHCNRFIAEHPDWYVAPVSPQNIDVCAELCEKWYAHHPSGRAIDNEKIALELAMGNFEALKMDGLLLFDGENAVAFSMGNKMAGSYYDVNFEKSFADVSGAYAMINREFSRMIAEKYPDVRFLNREDDMGVEGLRKAKSSYQPTVHLRKYIAEWE